LDELLLHLSGTRYGRFGEGGLREGGEHGEAPVVVDVPCRAQHLEPLDVAVADLAVMKQGRHLGGKGGCPAQPVPHAGVAQAG
jgi:hypothetical protein